jgi:serpin B
MCVLVSTLLFCPPSFAGDYSDKDILVMDNTAFAVELFRSLSTSEGNLFFSPHSISTALAMTYAGARGNTEGEMMQALCFSLRQDELHPAFAELESELGRIQSVGEVELRVANSLWPHREYPFLEEFLSLAERQYGVSITPVDYADSESARETINGWVEQKTQDRIQELIPRGILDALTRLVLVNAIYFKGNWKSAFQPEKTEEAPFYTAPGKTVQVSLMTQLQKFGYAEDDELQILELPYAGEDVSMLVLLPGEKDGLERLERDLTLLNLGRWRNRLHQRQVLVHLPRFSMTSMFRLDETLKSMGMIDAFDEERADFSGMDGKALLYLTAVLHKAFVDVNEEGTEAAAATGAVIGLKMSSPLSPPPPPVFRADRPFLFLIQHNATNSILFWGRVTDPSDKGGKE